MVCRQALLLGAHDGLLALDTSHDTVDCIREVLVVDVGLASARCCKRSFVADVGYIGTGESGSVLGYEVEVEVFGKLQALDVYLEDLLALVEVGKCDMDLAVETAGTHKGLVEDVSAVGSGQDDDSRVGVETVHLGEQLVKGVFTLVVGRESHVLATGTSDGVDLVYEDDAGGFLLGLLEQVTHARCAHAHEHLDEVGAGNGEERNVGLAGHGLGEKRFARAGRAYEEGSLGDLSAEGGILPGILEEVDDLHHLLLGSVQTCYILEGDVVGAFFCELASGLADIEDAAASGSAAAHVAAHAAEHEHPHENEQEREDDPLEDVNPGLGFILHYDLDLVVGRQLCIEFAELFLGIETCRDQEGEMR